MEVDICGNFRRKEEWCNFKSIIFEILNFLRKLFFKVIFFFGFDMCFIFVGIYIFVYTFFVFTTVF